MSPNGTSLAMGSRTETNFNYIMSLNNKNKNQQPVSPKNFLHSSFTIFVRRIFILGAFLYCLTFLYPNKSFTWLYTSVKMCLIVSVSTKSASLTIYLANL